VQVRGESLIKRAPAYSCSDVGDQTNNRKRSQIWTRISALRNGPLLNEPYGGDITDIWQFVSRLFSSW